MLESRGVPGRETHVRQASKSGRHSVDDRPCFDGCDDDFPRGIDPPEDLVAQARGSAPHNLANIFNPERAA